MGLDLTRRRTLITLAAAGVAAGAARGQAAPPRSDSSAFAARLRSWPALSAGVALTWRDGDAADLDAALASAGRHGIDADDARDTLRRAIDGGDPHRALTRIALAYGRALGGGLVDPAAVFPIFTLARRRADIPAGLRRVLLGDDRLGAWLDRLAPADDEYGALSREYLSVRTRIHESGDPGLMIRARTLALNLERRRWLSRDLADRRIDVNIPAQLLTYWRGDAPAWTTRVAVGRPDGQTPDIQASFREIVANPPWHVPLSIIRAEYRGKSPAFLRAQHMRWTPHGLVQAPGPWASLGLVKFDLHDPYAIYLHDTPVKGVFDDTARDLSHGCVRVQGAVDFARRLAGEDGREAAFDAALASGETRAVALASPVTVRLLYHTAAPSSAEADEGGPIDYLPDIYGRDAVLADALGMSRLNESAVGT